jgi:RNA polymerase sigma-70 factor (ECF subfamily)
VIFTTESITKEYAEQIYNEYSSFVYKVALFLIKSRTLAEDITQETFIQVFRKYHLYDSNKPFEPWIYRITINTYHNMSRKSRWLSFFGQQKEQQSNDLIEDTFFKEQEKANLWEEINKLSHKSREVIVLHFYLGMKLIEVSEVLNIPIGTCKSRLNSALNSLRKTCKDSTQNPYIIKGGEVNEAI